MNSRTTRFVNVISLSLLCGLAGTAAALAEPEKPASQTDAASSAPLGGPDVADRDVPGTSDTFGEEGMRDKAHRRERARPRDVLETLRSLGSPETPEALRLTEEQKTQLKAIAEEFGSAMRTFRQEHAEELKALREQAGRGPGGPRRGRGGPDGAPPQNAQGQNAEGQDAMQGDAPVQAGKPTPEQQAAREKLQELMKQGPNFEEYQTRAWAVLSPDQQALARERLEAKKENPAPRDGSTRERLRQRKGNKPADL